MTADGQTTAKEAGTIQHQHPTQGGMPARSPCVSKERKNYVKYSDF